MYDSLQLLIKLQDIRTKNSQIHLKKSQFGLKKIDKANPDHCIIRPYCVVDDEGCGRISQVVASQIQRHV